MKRICAVICLAAMLAALCAPVLAADSCWVTYEITAVQFLPFSGDGSEQLIGIPNGPFTVCVGLHSTTPNTADTLCIAAYSHNGQLLSCNLTAVTGDESQMHLMPLDNASGSIGCIKVFVLSASGAPISEAITRNADGSFPLLPVTMITWPIYYAMSSTEQLAFRCRFQSLDTWKKWRAAAQDASRVDTTELGPGMEIILG